MLTPEEQAELYEIHQDPLKFTAFYWPHIKLYDKQVEVLESLRDSRLTFVHAGTGLGKDFITSLGVLWFFRSRNPCKIIISSASEDHLRTVLWVEIRERINTARGIFHGRPVELPFKTDYLRVQLWTDTARTQLDPEAWVEGRVTNKVERIQGVHLDQDRPRVMAVFDEACHDDQTDVLTDRGWRRFAELTGEELLLTRNPETGECSYARPTHLHSSHYRGRMFLYERRGANFCVTPNHRMLFRRYDPHAKEWDPWGFEEIQNLNDPGGGYSMPRGVRLAGGREPSIFVIEDDGSKRAHDLIFPIKSFLTFLGWYFSEGHVGYDRRRNDRPGRAWITQKCPKVMGEICRVIEELGFEPRVHHNAETPQVAVGGPGSSQIGRWLSQFGRGAMNKRLPPFLRTLSPRLIRVFLDAFMRGDGYNWGSKWGFCTSSKQMADDLQELSILAGSNAFLSKRKSEKASVYKGRVIKSKHPGYLVRLSTVDSNVYVRRNLLQGVDYDGMVYCATVPPHHTLLTRRNGYPLWSGNSAIDSGFFDAYDGWAHRMLVIGNPLNTLGFFYHQCAKGDTPDPSGQNKLYRKVIKIGATDSPNVQWGLEWKRRGVEPPPPMPEEIRIPGLTNYAEYVQRLSEWDAFNIRTRLDGEFWTDASSLMFPPQWLDLAAQAARELGPHRKAKTIGVDGGEGRADSVWTAIDEFGIIEQFAKKTPNTMEIAGITIHFMRKHGVPAERVYFDRGGGGKQIADRLREQGYKVQTIGFGEAASPPLDVRQKRMDVRKEVQEVNRVFKNKRAEMYGQTREEMNPLFDEANRPTKRVFAVPAELTELRRELAVLPLLYDSEGRIFLPPKSRVPGTKSTNQVTIMDLLGHSPDRSDSLVLAVHGMKSRVRRKVGALGVA